MVSRGLDPEPPPWCTFPGARSDFPGSGSKPRDIITNAVSGVEMSQAETQAGATVVAPPDVVPAPDSGLAPGSEIGPDPDTLSPETLAPEALAQEAGRRHAPVMRDRIVEALAPALGGASVEHIRTWSRNHPIYVDGTLGMGGHAEAILDACPQAQLIGIDRDTDALRLAGARLARFGDRIRLVHAVFHELPQVLASLGVVQVQAILLDLGLSSLQIDDRERGFAYSVDAPLDMRMDATTGIDAATIVNEWSAQQLSRLFRSYGEEPFADRIARNIVAARAEQPFTTSARLVQVIGDSIPMAARKNRGHPAKRIFQALRIEVNGELDVLASVLPASLDHLAVGGRLAVLAYHSLEDRLVKRQFADACTDKAPLNLPVVPDALRAQFRLITRGAERPNDTEISSNPRAASARFRVIERIREAV